MDEYQDIDEPQYQLIAALAGKNESEDDARLNLMAVGDDDQSIYGFRDASVRFIRLFESDYSARTHFLTWNYALRPILLHVQIILSVIIRGE